MANIPLDLTKVCWQTLCQQVHADLICLSHEFFILFKGPIILVPTKFLWENPRLTYFTSLGGPSSVSTFSPCAWSFRWVFYFQNDQKTYFWPYKICISFSMSGSSEGDDFDPDILFDFLVADFLYLEYFLLLDFLPDLLPPLFSFESYYSNYESWTISYDMSRFWERWNSSNFSLSRICWFSAVTSIFCFFRNTISWVRFRWSASYWSIFAWRFCERRS